MDPAAHPITKGEEMSELDDFDENEPLGLTFKNIDERDKIIANAAYYQGWNDCLDAALDRLGFHFGQPDKPIHDIPEVLRHLRKFPTP